MGPKNINLEGFYCIFLDRKNTKQWYQGRSVTWMPSSVMMYKTLVRHKSCFNQILIEIQTLRLHQTQRTIPLKNTPPELSKTITEFQQAFTTPTTLPQKRVQFHPIPPPTQILTTTHITPQHTTND